MNSYEAMAVRQNNAREKFVATAMDLSGLDRETVERALVVFLKKKLVKLDAVCGQPILKTGQVYDRDVILAFA